MTYPSTITNYPDRVDKNASGWYISGEYFNIPSSTPYRMYLDHVPEEAATTHIYASGGAEWTEDLTGSPAAGEFYVEYDVGRVTFNSANAAAAMEARYDTLGDDIMAEHINNMQYEVYAIEGELGWDITGAYSTLSQRLNNFMTITDTVTASQVTCVTPPGASFTTVQGHIDADGGANVTDENPHGLGWNDIYDTDGDMVRAQSNITTGYLYANTISASGNQIGINVDGGEADQWIYFYDGGSAAGEWLKWDDGDNRFEFSNSLFVQGNVTASGNFMPEASGTRNVGSVTEALNAGYFDNLEASNQIWAKTYYGDGSNLEGVIADHNLLNYLAWSVAGHTIDAAITPTASGTIDLGSITLAFNEAYIDKVYLEADPTTTFQAANKGYVDDEDAAADAHITSDGSSHTFIDQSVVSGATPTFSATNFSDGGSNAIVTTTQETNWDNHIADNTQAHSDYLINTGDTIAGVLTPEASGTRDLGSITLAFDNAYMDKVYLEADPTTPFMAATKQYVDDAITGENLWDRSGATLIPHTVSDAVQLGDADTDTGTFTMIKGAQTGDPQVQFALSADDQGDVSITADTGDIVVVPAGLTFDVQSGGLSLIVGADSGVTTRTNVTRKYGRLSGYHYTNAEEPVCLIVSDSNTTASTVMIGGGTGLANAATNIEFYTAANSTTVTGTFRLGIDTSGNISVGNSAVDTGTFTMIKGAQTGDPQVQFALSANDQGDFSITADTGDILLAAADDVAMTSSQDFTMTGTGITQLKVIGGGTSRAQVMIQDGNGATYATFLKQDDAQFAISPAASVTELIINDDSIDCNTIIKSVNVADAFVMDAATDTASFGVDLELGNIEIEEDAGEIVLANMAVSDTPASGAPQSYSFQIDDTDIAKVYAEADSAGGIINERFEVSAGFVGTVDEVIATSEGVAASLTTLNTEVTTNGDSDKDIVTLASGVSGQIKNIYCVSLTGTDTWRVTPATLVGGDTIDFDNQAAGEGCTLVFADNEGWIMLSTNGGILP